MAPDNRGRSLFILVLSAALAAWEGACRLAWVSPVLLAPPSKVLAAGWELAASGALWPDLAATAAAMSRVTHLRSAYPSSA